MTPPDLFAALASGDSTQETITICNTGNEDLIFDIINGVGTGQTASFDGNGDYVSTNVDWSFELIVRIPV